VRDEAVSALDGRRFAGRIGGAPARGFRSSQRRRQTNRICERLQRERRSVDDLTPADFVVKEGGKARDVVAYRPAKAKMQIALIVDDNGTGLFRAPLYRFVERLFGQAEFAVVSVVGQPLKLTDYTMDGRVLSEVLEGLSARPGTPDGG
jgi:hypothetical protein